MAATNRIDAIDKALLRKGRFDHTLFVNNPTIIERKLLIEYFCNKYKLNNINTNELIIKYVDNVNNNIILSGADIENICKEYALKLMKENNLNY